MRNKISKIMATLAIAVLFGTAVNTHAGACENAYTNCMNIAASSMTHCLDAIKFEQKMNNHKEFYAATLAGIPANDAQKQQKIQAAKDTLKDNALRALQESEKSRNACNNKWEAARARCNMALDSCHEPLS